MGRLGGDVSPTPPCLQLARLARRFLASHAANYISGRDVEKLYRKPGWLWLIMPMMILWLCRVWLLASRGELNEDPVAFALTDPASLAIGSGVVMLALLAI